MSRIVEQRLISRRGMTLVEMIVAIAIFTAVMSGVILMFNSVTNTVRRSYRTMDMFESVRGALMAVERDVQTAFSSPATGADLHFFGEQHGFIFIGIAPNGRIGRLTYAVHRDTSRMSDPDSGDWRGEQMILSRKREELWGGFSGDDAARRAALSAYYPEDPNPEGEKMQYVDASVEVVYGVLLRYYEEAVDNVNEYEHMVNPYEYGLKTAIIAATEDRRPDPCPGDFSWFTKCFLWPPEPNPLSNRVNVPWYVRTKLETVEKCHYWLQLLHGPGLPTEVPRTLAREWWRDYYEGWAYGHAQPTREAWRSPLDLWNWQWAYQDRFWYDYVISGRLEVNAPQEKPFLWDHVVAQDFVLATFLLDPITGDRIVVQDDESGYARYVPVLKQEGAPEPIFQYRVETNVPTTQFNTLYNLNYENTAGIPGAMQRAVAEIVANPNDPNILGEVREMTASRQFYDLGSLMQSRLPSAFTITLWVLNNSVVANAPPDLYRFSQTIHIPSGFLRRTRTVQ